MKAKVKYQKKSRRYKKKKAFYQNRYFWLILVSLIFLISLFYFLFFANYFQVKNINFDGLKEVSEEKLISLIEPYLENKVLFFQSKSIFLINFNKIKKIIIEEVPLVEEVKIKRKFPETLSFLVVEREGLATFCQEDCFSLDKEGIIFDSEKGMKPIIKTALLEKIKLADRVIEKNELNQLLKINSYLEEELSIPLEELLVASLEKLEVMTKEGWKAYFNPQENVEWQLDKLKTLLEKVILPEQRKDLEWIELRFGNFANPKYKD